MPMRSFVFSSIFVLAYPWASWGQTAAAASAHEDGEGNRKVVWTLTRTVEAGEIVQREDVAPQLQGRHHVPGAVNGPTEIVGMQAARRLHAGTVVTRDQWKEMPLIRKGQGVRIVLETPHLRIVAPGESLQDGRAGERIRILNLSSRQSVSGRVQDAKTVVVDF